METPILIVHIVGALALGGVVGYTFYSIFTNKAEMYLKLSYTLGAGLIVQALSGSALELSMAHPALFLVYCSKIALYLGAVGVTQLALIYKMNNLQMQLPLAYIRNYSLITVVAIIATGLVLH
jgi:hypothetical protein